MKNVILLAVITIAVAVFVGCTAVPRIDVMPESDEIKENLQQEIAENDGFNDIDADVVEPEDIKAENVEPVTVSPFAAEDFLEPFEDYSWEREYKPEYVMLHFTSAVVLSKEDPYNMETVREIFEDNGLSIHYIIDRNGNVLCYMPEDRAAWHAGKGTFADDERLTNLMNKYSIGIEILAIGSEKDMAQYLTKTEYQALDKELIGFTEEQYTALRKLVKDICSRNGIPFDREHVIGHDMYNPSKNDPGELFDWNKVFDNTDSES